ncbi:MAG: peptidylprolyl isomerase [Cenarchaeum symbiont of Oopsacas minuta]|nr:peptidylprolyl isomerase [Cenarchaeum symbiont of Oopsacas minuta]
MTFETDSLLLVDFTAKIKDGKVFDTTYEKEAKEHLIHEAGNYYGPRLVSIGSVKFPVLRGFDEVLAASEVDQKLTIEVEPAKGFGERDSGLVRMIPLRKLGEEAEGASIGDTIEIDGKKGIIRYIGSGRVQIDYNHQFAGKTIIYTAHVKQFISKDDEKIQAMVDHHFGIKTTCSLDGIKAIVQVPDELLRSESIQIKKHLLQLDAFYFIPLLESINFVETYMNKKLAKKDSSKSEASDEPTYEDPDSDSDEPTYEDPDSDSDEPTSDDPDSDSDEPTSDDPDSDSDEPTSDDPDSDSDDPDSEEPNSGSKYGVTFLSIIIKKVLYLRTKIWSR